MNNQSNRDDRKLIEKQDKPKQEQQEQQLDIFVPPELTKGVYSNVALIRHTKNEFVMDFIFQIDGKGQLVSRVIMSPDHMRLFREAVEKNIKLFEDKKMQH
jgi:hypothetical protein